MNILTRALRYAVGTRENGNRRVYIDNIEDLRDINFVPHSRYSVKITSKEAVLKLNRNGEKKVIESKRGASIVELSDKKISEFLGKDTKYVTVQLKANEIRIKIHHADLQKQKRESKFLHGIRRKTILTGSLYSGVGGLTYAMHSGLRKAGFTPRIRFANEVDELAARLNVNYNPIWETSAKDAVFALDDIQTMDFSLMPDYVDHLEIALPCTGQSILTPKVHQDINHPIVGKLFIRTLEAISKMNTATLSIECTPSLINSITFDCVKDYLEKNNYSFETIVLKGSDFGDFEVRKRFCLFAVSKGLSGLFPKLEGIAVLHRKNQQTFADIKDEIKKDSPIWKEYSHIKKRNGMKNVGYKNILVKDSDNRIPALVAGYGAPSAGYPFIPSPDNENLQRQITVNEHTKIRKFPIKLASAINQLAEGLLKGQTRTNKTAAHRICGNSVSPTPWKELMFYMFSGLRIKDSNQLTIF